jgi:hypothetical protein
VEFAVPLRSVGLMLGGLHRPRRRVVVQRSLSRCTRLTGTARGRHFQCAHAVRAYAHDYGIAIFRFGLDQEGVFKDLDFGESGFLQI